MMHANEPVERSGARAQEMRTYKEAEQAGKNAGFELVRSIDIATASPVTSPWCGIAALTHTLLQCLLAA